MKKRILFISMCLPYADVGHAGGKTLNYYINRFANENEFEVKLISKVLPDEINNVGKLNNKIDFYPIMMPKNTLKRFLAFGSSINSKINPFYKYGNVLTNEIYKQIENSLCMLKNEKYEPDIIVMEWTYILLFIKTIKKYYPNAKYVASEHDVSFLGYQRKFDIQQNLIKKIISYIQFKTIFKYEFECLRTCDLVVTHNEKDMQLLLNNGFPSRCIHVISPYYDTFEIVKKTKGKDIIFYGAMNRYENYQSAIWFIDNVIPLLKDEDIRFIVVGNKPPEVLKEKECSRIIVTGFVKDPSIYFEKALCFVAPLLLGAGVKVKILEALSSGIPVLTNNIGIEGIDAKNGREYIHCDTPQEYADVIKKIINGKIDVEEITNSALKFMKIKYNLNESYVKYKEKIETLL